MIKRLPACFFLIFVMAMNASSGACLITNNSAGVGFFNGVGVERLDANESAAKLGVVVHHPVVLFYNHTEGLTQDLLEVFEQRMAELPGVQSVDYSLFSGFRINAPMAADVVAAQPELANVQRRFQRDVTQKQVAALMRPVTGADYVEHNQRLQLLLRESGRVVLIAHSQGNLFVNHAFEQLPPEQQRHTSVVHVAPASLKLHGDYVLSDKDVVISLLAKTTGIGHKPNVSSVINPLDLSGHELVASYLNTWLNPADKMQAAINRELAKSPRLVVSEVYGTYCGNEHGVSDAIGYQHYDGMQRGCITLQGKRGAVAATTAPVPIYLARL